MITDQVGVVCPLEVLLHCAIIQSNPGVIMTQTFDKDIFLLNKTLMNVLSFISLSVYGTEFYEGGARSYTKTQTKRREHTRAGLQPAAFWLSSKSKTIFTINKLLLGSRDDATEVSTVLSTVLLCILPSVSVCEVPAGKTPPKQIWKYIFHIQPGRFKCYRTPGVWRISPGWDRLECR